MYIQNVLTIMFYLIDIALCKMSKRNELDNGPLMTKPDLCAERQGRIYNGKCYFLASPATFWDVVMYCNEQKAMLMYPWNESELQQIQALLPLKEAMFFLGIVIDDPVVGDKRWVSLDGKRRYDSKDSLWFTENKSSYKGVCSRARYPKMQACSTQSQYAGLCVFDMQLERWEKYVKSTPPNTQPIQ